VPPSSNSLYILFRYVKMASSSSPYHNFDFESVAFGLGSFLVFENSADLKSAFHDRMQLTLPSTALALPGLLNFLDKWYPGPRFFLSNKKRRGKIAAQWLGRAGRVYWGKDSGHIREDVAGTEGLEWPEEAANERLQLCVVEMLDGLALQARAFYQVCSNRTP
jgi:hypothetical protein